MKQATQQRDFAPFPLACVERGIHKTVAYELLNGELLETFTIGRKRYVYLDSLLTLPERIDKHNARKAQQRQAQQRREAA